MRHLVLLAALAAGGASSAVTAGATAAVAMPAATPPLVRMLVDNSTAMPMSRIEHGEVLDGILRDVGLALARELGTRAVLTPMPRKRIGVMLEQGDSDLACHFLPLWLPARVDWTVGFMPNATLLLSSLEAPAPASVDRLRGVPIGTVLGFAYPEMEQVLGPGFVRDDAGDAVQNLTKFAAGRTRHALAGEVFFTYQQRLHPHLLQVQRPLVLSRYEAQCAVSKRSRYPLARINEAIRALQKRGQIAAIYARYRNGAATLAAN